VVVDLGAGEGSLARRLAQRVERVHAVELSQAMVDAGRQLPGGTARGLSWSVERVELFTAPDPIGLAVAGASMHWFDLEAVCARLAKTMRRGAPRVICDRTASCPGLDVLTHIIQRYSRAPDHDATYRVADLQNRGLWHRTGEHETSAVTFRQIGRRLRREPALHGISLARELMTPAESTAFDDEVAGALTPLVDDRGVLTLSLTCSLAWGALDSSAR